MKTSICVAIILLAMVSAAVGADKLARPMLPSAGEVAVPIHKTEVPANLTEAEYVFAGKLEKVTAGPTAKSLPPIYHHTLEFTVEKVFRGPLKEGEKVVCNHSARQMARPEFPEGKVCLVTGQNARGFLAQTVELFDAAKVNQIKLACMVPMGWKVEDGKAMSPWAEMGAKAWSAEMDGASGAITCAKTNRPVLMAGEGVKFDVAHVPPVKDIQWTNPDGDGEYKITVTNATDKPIAVPALLSADGKILWSESLVILCQGRNFACPGCKGVSGKVEATKLEPGQSVSTTVNALALKGPEWPKGGYRIEFRFCLGEKSKTQSFYYMSHHHDKLRDAAQKANAAPAEGK